MKKQKYNIRLRSTETMEVLGYKVCKHFGVRQTKTPNGWRIDHLPTGYHIVSSSKATFATAKALVEYLDSVQGAPWESPDPKNLREYGNNPTAMREAILAFQRTGNHLTIDPEG